MKSIVTLSVLALFLGLAVTVSTVAAQEPSNQEILLRLETIEKQLDRTLVILQGLDEKSKREEYFAGCVLEMNQCGEGGICGANERNRWVKDDPKCGNTTNDAIFGCYCKG